ncbi:hypothetical protein [Nocardioides daejeonensis]|uniref:hypothetical protein n=1 Tax=Nocardioides daejeonensis TaxID=1046556 RepID=UPI000D7453C8|nr:hypothetical protein [Nocardioides daejeonensis]
MSERTVPRPPQVTFSGWAILVGSVVVLISVYDTVARLRSIDTREQIEKSLSEPPLSGTGLDLQRVIDLMHGASLVAGACAAAMAILGVFVLQRHQQARVVISVLAVPLFVSGLLVGGFAASLVAVSVVLLWTRPARDWFAGRAPQPRTREAGEWPAAGGSGAWPQQTGQAPQETQGHEHLPGSGQDALPTPQAEVPPAGPEGPRPWAGYGAANPALARRAPRRPGELVAACVLVWVFAGFSLASTLTAMLVLPADDTILRDLYESDERFSDSGVALSTLRTMVVVMSVLLSAWALAALAMAGFAFAGFGWARWILFASCVATALFSLLLAAGAPMMLVLTGASAYAAVLLTRSPVTAWYSNRRDARR